MPNIISTEETVPTIIFKAFIFLWIITPLPDKPFYYPPMIRRTLFLAFFFERVKRHQ